MKMYRVKCVRFHDPDHVDTETYERVADAVEEFAHSPEVDQLYEIVYSHEDYRLSLKVSGENEAIGDLLLALADTHLNVYQFVEEGGTYTEIYDWGLRALYRVEVKDEE